jgi:L-fuculose-phosphate aldolase
MRLTTVSVTEGHKDFSGPEGGHARNESEMNEFTALREELTKVYRELDRSGLIFLAAGNVSVRLGAGMLISPTGASADSIEPQAFIETNFEGQASSGRPSSEWAMHAAIYKAFPEAKAVVHTHSDHCVAMASVGASLPPFHYMVASFGGAVRCTPYTLWATQSLADLAVEALVDRTACFLGNHGMICHGSALRKAFNCAIRLEVLCRQYIIARQAGKVRLLSEEEMRAARERYRGYDS